MSIAVNSPPECGGAVLSVISRDCVGDIGRSGCPVTAMLAKLRIILNNASGLTAMCSDADAPVKYRLLAFTTSCSSTSKGQVLGSSAAPTFASIIVASGVRSLGIEATDSLGATFRTCSSDISVNAASAAALSTEAPSRSALHASRCGVWGVGCGVRVVGWHGAPRPSPHAPSIAAFGMR